jgi:hypothetical protein
LSGVTRVLPTTGTERKREGDRGLSASGFGGIAYFGLHSHGACYCHGHFTIILSLAAKRKELKMMFIPVPD